MQLNVLEVIKLSPKDIIDTSQHFLLDKVIIQNLSSRSGEQNAIWSISYDTNHRALERNLLESLSSLGINQQNLISPVISLDNWLLNIQIPSHITRVN